MADDVPEFPPDAGPVRPVLVLDVLGRTVRVDALRHAEVLAALAAHEAAAREGRDRAAKALPVPRRRKGGDQGGTLFGG